MTAYSKQSINQQDIDAVIKALQSDLITQGPRVAEFERSVADKVAARHAIATNSATSCLHLACLALGLKKGQTVWTSPITFVATANCALFCQATIDFVDIDPKTYNLCPQKLAEKLSIAKMNNCLPHIVIAVHMCGQSCDMQAIYALSKQYGFHIIEDASHAIGARYQDKYIGNGQFSDICVFSFHPVKIITSAEGGMALTNNDELASRMSKLRSHGITRSDDELFEKDRGPWYYEQQTLGFNYRMTELQAALGISQLTRLDEFISKRRYLAHRYNEKLAHLALDLPFMDAHYQSAWHLYIVQLHLPNKRRAVFEYLKEKGIGVQVHYIPVHTQPFYRAQGFDWGQFHHAEKYYHAAITLPLFFDMTEQQQDYVITRLQDALA